MKKNNISNHLSEELLISLLEGGVGKVQEKQYYSHLKSCDKCFVKFSSLYASHKEMDKNILEVTPDSLVERANREFNLAKPKRVFATINEEVIEKLKIGYGHLSNIFRPRVVAYAVITTFILLIIFVPILFQKEDSISKEAVRNILEKQMNKPGNSVVLSSDNDLGIKVFLNVDTLRITQPYRFNRTLIIISNTGTVLYTSTFSDLTNDIILKDTILNESSTVTITSLDTIVYENPISILRKN